MILTLRNQSFVVKSETNKDERVIRQFNKNLTTYQRVKERGKTKWLPKDIYYIHDKVNDTYHYIAGTLKQFTYLLQEYGYAHHKPTIITEKYKPTKENNIEYHSEFLPRDEQPMFIEGMTKEENKIVLVMARTGYGKTFMTATAISIMKSRVMFYIRPTYIAKWISDITKYFNVNEDDIFIINSGKRLRDLMELGEAPEFIIASNATMMEYIKNHFNGMRDQFPIAPNDLLKHLDISLLVSDESHQFFNNLTKAVIALNPYRFIGLSATLISKDKKIEQMYLNMFPEESRLDLNSYKKYTHFKFHEYYLANMSERDARGAFGYNHNIFEENILKRPTTKNNFFKMIFDLIDEHYIKDKRPGDKLLVYAKGLKMIRALREALSQKYSDLDVRKYIRGSDESDVLDPDIRVSHPNKSGALVDIPQLVLVINTINVDSPAQIVQMAGRLREIPGRDVLFIQLFSSNITKHRIYTISNQKYLDPLAVSKVWTKNRHVI